MSVLQIEGHRCSRVPYQILVNSSGIYGFMQNNSNKHFSTDHFGRHMGISLLDEAPFLESTRFWRFPGQNAHYGARLDVVVSEIPEQQQVQQVSSQNHLNPQL